MEYTKELLADKRVQIKMNITHAEWEEHVQNAYEKTKAKYKVQGFRNGKVPRKVIEKTYGETVFFDEAINDCFYKHYDDIIKKEQIEPVGNPSLDVEKLDKDGAIFVITTVIYPEVKLGEYKGLEIEKPEVKVTAAEVNGAIKDVQNKSARLVAVEREAKKNDTVIIDFLGKKDGVAFAGGEGKNFELVLGSGMFIPGFEDQLVGIKAGESRKINVTFPTDYPAEDLAGKECTFDCDCHEVREKVLPELDDEFAQNVSEFDTFDEYKKSVKADLLKQKQLNAEQEYTSKLLEKITDNATIDIPQKLVDDQIEMTIAQFDERLRAQGLNFDDYVKYMNTTIDAFRKSREEDARKTVKTRLVIEEIIKQEKIQLQIDEFNAELERQASFSGIDVEEYRKSLSNEMIGNMANNMLMNKLFDFLKANNK